MNATPSFRYWNTVDPATFLKHDWQNPSRAWAAEQAMTRAHASDGTLLEIGPGAGTDYAAHWRSAVQAGSLHYDAYEGSLTLWQALRQRFPEATWRCQPLVSVPAASAAVVYARHVLEHQPALEPALSVLLRAARETVVLTWYRPPNDRPCCEYWAGVPCQTFARDDVLHGIAATGFDLTVGQSFPSGDEAWVLERVERVR